MSQRILIWAFYILFFLTPLVFTPFNHELFEFNKMILVYGLTAVITTVWLVKMVNQKTLIINRTPLDIPIILFLFSQILSAIFSIDPHTSWWGYYSRSNGGLYSIIAYLLLYFGLVSNFRAPDVLKFLKAALFGGLLVSLYAIPEHFGASPSCTLLNLDQGFQLRADCWVQDVQSRVFATMGQPNWLAAYLAMLVFPAMYFLLQAKELRQKAYFFLLITCFYLAFTFTFSRGATIGFIVGLVVFLAGWIFLYSNIFKKMPTFSLLLSHGSRKKQANKNNVSEESGWNGLILISAVFLLINLLFGSALTGDFKLLQAQSVQPRPIIGGGGTQLESGGTESGQIRLIVWQGAVEIFKHYPLFGSGVETFAYSYYNFRPIAHNLTSEWDFLYNKAHNEYLNYLATTGLVGFGTYLLMILTFIGWSIMRIYNLQLTIYKKFPMWKIQKSKQVLEEGQKLLLIVILAGYISYLVQNFFGFSVVIIAVFFYIFPALAVVFVGDLKPLQLPKKLHRLLGGLLRLTVLRGSIYQKTVSVLLVLGLLFVLGNLSRNWMADFLYKTGSDASDSGEIEQAYLDLSDAVQLNEGEPLYRSELGFTMADVASALKTEDASTSAELAEEAVRQTKLALSISPKNISLWRTAVRAYYQMSLIDPTYVDRALEALDESIKLAPTDPKLYYNKGLVLSQNGKVPEGVEALKEAIKLKSNYTEAHFTLSLLYEQLKEKDLAIQEMEEVLKLDPGNEDAVRKIEELKEE